MKLNFQYSLDKDIENWFIASQSINNKQSTKMQELYKAAHGQTLEREKLRCFIRAYLDSHNIRPTDEIERIEKGWRTIEDAYLTRVEKLFSIASPRDVITVFLTIERRCGYKIQDGYFFVSIIGPVPNLIIMHELFHFWTWFLFHEEVESDRITEGLYNNIKESLTVLLNLEFQDLLGGAVDKGYPQHAEMRARICELWKETKDIKKVFEGVAVG